MNYVNGIDVSRWQGDIDFNAVRGADNSVVFIKATEGATFVDSRFASNWHKANAAGLHTGAYHYVHAVSSPPAAQKDNIVKTLHDVGFNPTVHAYMFWPSILRRRVTRKPLLCRWPTMRVSC